MPKGEEIHDSRYRVKDFYEGKNIFITGAAGYFGAVLLETLLRCFPGIQAIYILLREKKGVEPEARKEVIFSKAIFDTLKKTGSDFMEKVHVISGDISQPNLGMSKEDLLMICQNVSIVFHVAASIVFTKPYKYMLTQNSLATSHVIELCRKLKTLDVLIFTSTAYSNSNRKTPIKEIIYRLPFPPQMFLDELNHGTDESLENLVAQCEPRWPNSYTFSKALSENIILDMASDLPVAIVRPSVIGSTLRTPVEGYVEEDSGFVMICIGVGKGFIRVLHFSPDCKLDVIPVDICSHAHVVAGWSVATGRSPSPLVVNCTSYGEFVYEIRYMIESLIPEVKKQPLPKSFQKPKEIIMINNTFLYRIVAAYEHYVPAYVMDCFLRLSGKKPRLVKLYKFLDRAIDAVQHFVHNSWIFESLNFKELSTYLNEEEKKTFDMSMKGVDAFTWVKITIDKCHLFRWESEKKMEEHKKVIYRRYVITSFIKGVEVAILCLVFAFIISFFIPDSFQMHY